jgi:hypothetical protein
LQTFGERPSLSLACCERDLFLRHLAEFCFKIKQTLAQLKILSCDYLFFKAQSDASQPVGYILEPIFIAVCSFGYGCFINSIFYFFD